MDKKDKLSKIWGRRHASLRNDLPKWYADQVDHSFWQAIAEDSSLTREEKNAFKSQKRGNQV